LYLNKAELNWVEHMVVSRMALNSCPISCLEALGGDGEWTKSNISDKEKLSNTDETTQKAR